MVGIECAGRIATRCRHRQLPRGGFREIDAAITELTCKMKDG